MPRVTKHTASNRGATYTCTACGEPIVEGEQYFMWLKRSGPKAGYRRHVKCGFPRPSQLSGRKTAVIEDAIQDYSAPGLDGPAAQLEQLDWDNLPESLTLDASVWEDAVEQIASAAEEVADEYESNAENMPDSLQSSPTYEAMTDVAERLREWAETLRDKAQEDIEVDLPERGADDTYDNWMEQAEEAVQAAWDEHGSEVDDAMGDMPEYEG